MDTTIEASIIKALPFIEALHLFHQVEDACFGQLLKPNYKDCIQNFMASYRSLGISIPLKVNIFVYGIYIKYLFFQVHLLETHVVEFLQAKGEVAGLGFWSEQAMESCHHDFKLEYENLKICQDSPEFLERLRSLVVCYNGKHL